MAVTRQPPLDRLQAILNQTGLAQQNNPLYQVINGLIAQVRQFQSVTNNTVNSGLTILADRTYLTVTDESADLPNSKQTGLTGFTAGSIIFSNGDALLAEDNSNLFWNNANNRLGLKTNTPTVTFDIIESALITTTTISSRLHNLTAATNAVRQQISPAMEFSGNAWDVDTAVNVNARIALYNKPATDNNPFPGLYFATNVGAGWVDQLLFGSANGDNGQLNWRLGSGTNIIFSRSGRGIFFTTNPLTDAVPSSHFIAANSNGKIQAVPLTGGSEAFFEVEQNVFGVATGTIPALRLRCFDNSTSSPQPGLLQRAVPGGTAAAGFGSRIWFQASSNTTSNQDQGGFDCVWTDATHATRTSAFDIYLVNSAAALARIYRFLATGEFQTLASGLLTFSARSKISSPADSNILLTNNAASAFDRLQFGGTSSSFPALKRNAALIEVKLADDSAFAQFSALEFINNRANFLMRTAVAWNDGAAANVGTLNNAPAAGDPTKWIPVDDNGTTRYIPAW